MSDSAPGAASETPHLLLARGRWNRHDEYGCLYTSLSPSASLAGARNLNLYIDGRADHLRLTEGPERAPLNY